MLYQLARNLAYALFRLHGRLTAIGREHVPLTGGVVLAPNHTSYADPPLMGALSPRPVWFMAKAELFRNALFGRLITATHAFPVRRGAVDRQALQKAHALLTAGNAVTIFIEGGRSPDGRLMPPTLGPAMIALRAGVPIVPVAILDADRLLPGTSKRLRRADVTVVFGEPLTFPHLAGRTADRQALQEVSDTVMRRIAEMMCAHGGADRVPPEYLPQEDLPHDG